MTERKQAARKRLVSELRDVVEHCAGMNARLAARRLTRFLEARMANVGLSFAQFALMAQVAAAEDDTIGGLAARLELDQSTLSRNLRGLERAGLVEIAVVEKDLRRRAVWLTEAGARRLETALPAWREAQEALAEIIGPGEVQKIARVTAALSASV